MSHLSNWDDQYDKPYIPPSKVLPYKIIHVLLGLLCSFFAALELKSYLKKDLVERGARVNLVDKRGNLPLHLAIQYCLGMSSLHSCLLVLFLDIFFFLEAPFSSLS